LWKTTLVLLVFLFFFPTFLANEASARPKYRLKISIQPPERSLWGQTVRTIAREIEEETQGEVQLKMYAGGVQGDERTVLRKMRVGQLHGGVFLSDGLTVVCPDSLALGLPLLFKNQDEVDYALEKISPELESQAREKGYEILAWPQLGFSYLFSKERIRTMDDLRGAKPWLMEKNPVGKHLFEVLRVTPVSTGVANVLPALESGLVRTVVGPPLVLIAMQWHSRVKYRLEVNITFSVGAFVLGGKAWARLPEAHRKTIRTVFQRNNVKLNAKIRKEGLEAVEVLEKQGVETVPIEPKSREEYERGAEEVGKRMAGKEFSQTILDKVQALLREYRQSAPKK
jgi:TRAP-type C4-dicarboxylate transport system substrate-binding protein